MWILWKTGTNCNRRRASAGKWRSGHVTKRNCGILSLASRQRKDFTILGNEQAGRLGRYMVKTYEDETVRAFLPPPLPPDPPVRLEGLQQLLEQANHAIGRLDGIASVLPDLSLFIYTYVRKEAVLSSQIEGTQSSLSDLLLFEHDEVPGVPTADVQEVSNYVAAMNHGLARMRAGFPLSLRLIREIHKILLSKGRGSEKEPGEFRRSQNWIGGSRPGNAVFVPPPPDLVDECMGNLELFLHEQRRNSLF